MPAGRDWEDTIRAVVSHALSQKGCRRGWTGQAPAGAPAHSVGVRSDRPDPRRGGTGL